MATDEMKDCKDWHKHKKGYRGPGCGGGAIYGMGIIGGWFYFIGQADSFWAGVGGFFQGIFWPAYVVYEALKALIS
jgi:hypothetical protein